MPIQYISCVLQEMINGLIVPKKPIDNSDVYILTFQNYLSNGTAPYNIKEQGCNFNHLQCFAYASEGSWGWSYQEYQTWGCFYSVSSFVHANFLNWISLFHLIEQMLSLKYTDYVRSFILKIELLLNSDQCFSM
jgi:hypothetical protein